MNRSETAPNWTTLDAEDLYGIQNWGAGYFALNGKGEVQVNLAQSGQEHWVSLKQIGEELEERGITAPVLLRFSNILDNRITLLNESFQSAIANLGYQNEYRGVFPIKVNQQQQVIGEIARFGKRYHHGLEAGSKPELIAAMSTMHDPKALIICNGYKDAEFVDLALYSLKMGLSVFLVVEMPGEIDLILDRADALGVTPRIGLRARLSTPGSGKWDESGGDRSVFGLNAAQIIDVVDKLRAAGKLDCLELLHYHLGSQIPSIRTIRDGATEAARVYVDLVKEGARMGQLDVGGGLAVDYDGSNSDNPSSRNYGIDEYSSDIVEAVMLSCDRAEVPHPVLISESGRSTVAHYAMLLFNILDVGAYSPARLPAPLQDDAPETLKNLYDLQQNLSEDNFQECYNDALYYRDALRGQFTHGVITLRDRGLGERIFSYTVKRIADIARRQERVPEAMQNLEEILPDIYYANFSIFQSLPDAWAIDQLFPIMPLHRLDEEPSHEGIFADITCDCDGKLDRFIDPEGARRTLPLHGLREGEAYYVGAFLVGAYQETLGDLHNLFGDTNVVSVELDEEGEVEFSHEVQGDTVADVLSYVEYDPKEMTASFRRFAERAVRNKRISSAERKVILDAFVSGMQGYTYFEHS